MSNDPIPRYCDKPFPPYTYVPGSGTPHPVSHPQGHMFGHAAEVATPLDPERWHRSGTYLYAIDLFNHGYYWEAHEAWESLWHAAGNRGQIADFLKGLIKLAAAGVKSREGNASGVERHLKRGQELLRSIGAHSFCGVDMSPLLENIERTGAATNGKFNVPLVVVPPLP